MGLFDDAPDGSGTEGGHRSHRVALRAIVWISAYTDDALVSKWSPPSLQHARISLFGHVLPYRPREVRWRDDDDYVAGMVERIVPGEGAHKAAVDRNGSEMKKAEGVQSCRDDGTDAQIGSVLDSELTIRTIRIPRGAPTFIVSRCARSYGLKRTGTTHWYRNDHRQVHSTRASEYRVGPPLPSYCAVRDRLDSSVHSQRIGIQTLGNKCASYIHPALGARFPIHIL
jgi:hypothetical protein